MKILYVCRFLPHPQVRDSGGQDTYHYIASLSEQHTVSVIAFVTREQQAAVKTLQAICAEVVAVSYRHDAWLARMWRAGWRLVMPRVYGRVFSIRYRAALRKMLRQNDYDIAVVDGMMAQYGDLLQDTKRVLDEVDIYSIVAYHLYRNERRRWMRAWSLFDWLRTWHYELGYAQRYDGILVRSEKDRLVLREHLPDQKIAIAPPWFEGLDELQSIPLERPSGNHLLFVGAMNLPANIEAASRFAHQILPLIRQQIPDATFHIVGAAPAPELLRLAQKRQDVIVTGEVANLKPYYAQCAVNVVPLLTGGGIIVKTLNGMAAGRPTVATETGNSGTGAQPGRDLLVVDKNEQAFARAVVDLLTDDVLWKQIAQNGRQFIRKQFDWPQSVRCLAQFLETILQN